MAEVTPTPTPTPTAPWYAGADAETVGYLQTKGLAEKTAKEAALAAIASHRQAEKFIGAPADKLIRLPKDASDAEAYATMYDRLGVPKEAKGYSFEGIKFKDGSDLDEGFTTFMADRALKNHLTPAQAKQLATDLVEFMGGAEERELADHTASLDAERAKLKANWTPANFDQNMVTARNAAAALKVTPEEVEALQGVVGYARVMEMFRQIGTRIGEHRFVENPGNPGSGNVMTREQAVSRKGELMRDNNWREGYLKGDTEKNREMLALNAIITGDTESLPMRR